MCVSIQILGIIASELIDFMVHLVLVPKNTIIIYF
jgi:hypothetical protein